MNFQNSLPRGLGLISAAGALFFAAAACTAPARADGLPNPLANFMGGGDDNAAIDYRPRPALVVPPTNDLPPPQQPSSNVRGANWPKARDTTILNAAKADSRRPAPSEDSQPSGDAGSQKVVLQGDNECNKILGMPTCLEGWGQDGGKPKPVVLSAPQRRYLIEPPASYMAGVPIQPGEANYTPPPSCATPGWFGCPEQPDTAWRVLGMQPPGPNGAGGGAGANGGGAAPNATAGDAPPGQIFGQQAPAPQKKCPLGPGWFGCQEMPQTYSQPQPPGSQAQAQSSGTLQSSFEDQATGPVPPGQVFGQPRAPLQQHCLLNGWFGCQEQ